MDGTQIAYFTMEIGLKASIPTYSGGLGVLAGDTIKSAADLNVPLVCITLLHRKGYFTQKFEDHWQKVAVTNWNPEDEMELLDTQVQLGLEGRTVTLNVWKYEVVGIQGHVVPVYFLDADVDGNTEWDRGLTSQLYGGDHWFRMCQEIVLGIGGLKMLRALKIPVDKYHMNEGHAAFLTLELRKEASEDDNKVDEEEYGEIKGECIFTTHTPVPAGHDAFDPDWVRKALGNEYPIDDLNCYKDGKFNMTLLAMNHSAFINGVAKKHGQVSREMFPGYHINDITNGVHALTWTSPHFQRLFDDYISGWQEDNFMLRYSLNIPDKEIWHAHEAAKDDLMKMIDEQTGHKMDPRALTIGFARRFATYKRADLIFRDMDRLLRIVDHAPGPLQIVMSGKAHPADGPGIEKLKFIRDLMAEYRSKIKMVFLEDYNMESATTLIAGVDVWLNTPIRPREASGTSGMKATLNGVINFSVLDGWWLEGWVEGVTGWSIGPMPKHGVQFDEQTDIDDLYEKLKHKILPTYYENRAQWIFMMKHGISHNGSFFSTQRMVSQYLTKSWLV